MKVKIKNFMSFKEVEFDLKERRYGIIGYNLDEGGSNGSGKSAIIEAIVWALYGESIRRIPLAQLVKHGEGEMAVCLKNDKMELIRKYEGQKSYAELKIEGRKVIGVNNVNQEVEKLFGSFNDFVLFNCFSDLYRFSRLTDSEKKQLIARLIDLERIDRIEEAIKKEAKSVEIVLYETKARMDAIERVLKRNSEALKNTQAELDKIGVINEKDIVEYKKIINVVNTLEAEKRKIKDLLAIVENDEKAIMRDMKMIEKGVCPTCGRPFVENYNEIKAKYENALAEIQSSKKNLNNDFERINREIEKYESFDLDEIYKMIEGYGRRKELLAVKKDLENQIEEDKNKLKKLAQKQNEYNELLDVYEFWKKHIGFKGVKFEFMKTFFDVFSERVNYYLDLFGFPFMVEFESEEKKFDYIVVNVFDGKVKRRLDTFSQGEKRKIDIAIMFALRDFAEKKFDYIFFDEVFDGLDIQSIEKIVFVLESLDEKFLVVSHINLQFPFPIFIVEKKGGVSVIKQA